MNTNLTILNLSEVKNIMPCASLNFDTKDCYNICNNPVLNTIYKEQTNVSTPVDSQIHKIDLQREFNLYKEVRKQLLILGDNQTSTVFKTFIQVLYELSTNNNIYITFHGNLSVALSREGYVVYRDTPLYYYYIPSLSSKELVLKKESIFEEICNYYGSVINDELIYTELVARTFTITGMVALFLKELLKLNTSDEDLKEITKIGEEFYEVNEHEEYDDRNVYMSINLDQPMQYLPYMG